MFTSKCLQVAGVFFFVFCPNIFSCNGGGGADISLHLYYLGQNQKPEESVRETPSAWPHVKYQRIADLNPPTSRAEE